jgi:hypothetical protein
MLQEAHLYQVLNIGALDKDLLILLEPYLAVLCGVWGAGLVSSSLLHHAA